MYDGADSYANGTHVILGDHSGFIFVCHTLTKQSHSYHDQIKLARYYIEKKNLKILGNLVNLEKNSPTCQINC